LAAFEDFEEPTDVEGALNSFLADAENSSNIHEPSSLDIILVSEVYSLFSYVS